MSKNLIPEIARMLGVEIGEEFKVKGYEELMYRFAADGLKLTYDSSIELSDTTAKVAFVALLNGKDEIVKLPWKPKKGNTCWTFGADGDGVWCATFTTWSGHPMQVAMLKAGWVFCNKAEAKAALPAVAKEMGAKYEL